MESGRPLRGRVKEGVGLGSDVEDPWGTEYLDRLVVVKGLSDGEVTPRGPPGGSGSGPWVGEEEGCPGQLKGGTGKVLLSRGVIVSFWRRGTEGLREAREGWIRDGLGRSHRVF